MTAQQASRKPRSQKRQRPAVAGARLTEAEMAKLRARAERDGQSISNLVRSVLVRELELSA